MDKQKVLNVLSLIEHDQRNDAAEFDGKPFNGRTVATYFGNQGASIAALAQILQDVIQEVIPEPEKRVVMVQRKNGQIEIDPEFEKRTDHA